MKYFSTFVMSGSMLFATTWTTSCKSDSSFKQNVEPSSSAIRAAENVGASDSPGSAYYLRLAKENLEQAKALAKEGKKIKATSFLERAEADATLAIAMAQKDTEKANAADAMSKVRQLRKDNQLPVWSQDDEDEGSTP